MKANLIIIILVAVVVLSSAVIIASTLSSKPDDKETAAAPEGGGAPQDGAVPPAGGAGPGKSEKPKQPAETTQPPKPPAAVEDPKLTEALTRFNDNQKHIKWLRAKLTMTRAGLVEDPGTLDEKKRETGTTQTGELELKPGNRCRFTLTSDNNGVKETEDWRVYIQTLWIIKTSGETKKATRWPIDNERMAEALLLLQGTDLAKMRANFNMRLIDLWDADEEKRLTEEGYDVAALKKEKWNLVELIYRDQNKKDQYKMIEAVIDGTGTLLKIKLYNGMNNEYTIIWFDETKINAKPEIEDLEFRFIPGDLKFDDYVSMKDKDPLDIMARMKLTTRQVIGVGADIEQDSYNAVNAAENPGDPNAGHERKSGTFLFKPPDKFKMSFTKPKAEIVASNGKSSYIYRPDIKRAELYDLRQMAATKLGGDLSILSRFFSQNAAELAQDFDVALIGMEKLNGWEVYHLDLTLKKKEKRGTDAKYSAEHLELWVEVETLLATQMKVYSSENKANYHQVTLKDIDIWETTADAEYEPVFPEGTEKVKGQ
jgi:outer membrane lipoprotein-sorting protein